MPGPHEVIGFPAPDWQSRVVRPLEQASTPDHLLLFSNGEISRKQAMRHLEVSYSELLDRLANRELPLPRVSAEQAEAMANLIVSLTAGLAR